MKHTHFVDNDFEYISNRSLFITTSGSIINHTFENTNGASFYRRERGHPSLLHKRKTFIFRLIFKTITMINLMKIFISTSSVPFQSPLQANPTLVFAYKLHQVHFSAQTSLKKRILSHIQDRLGQVPVAKYYITKYFLLNE